MTKTEETILDRACFEPFGPRELQYEYGVPIAIGERTLKRWHEKNLLVKVNDIDEYQDRHNEPLYMLKAQYEAIGLYFMANNHDGWISGMSENAVNELKKRFPKMVRG